MSTPQHRINSPFGYRSTAAEVLEGIDLETTRALVGAGAHVVVPARRPAAAKEALAGLERVEVEELDLADLDSVHGFAARFLESGRGIDMLINNAAIMACPETRVGPGWE